jgi:hypothetical protein
VRKLCSLKRLGRVRLSCGVRALAGLIASLTFETSRSFKYINFPYPKSPVCPLYIYKSSDPVVSFQRGLVPACRMAKVRTRSFSRPAFERK